MNKLISGNKISTIVKEIIKYPLNYLDIDSVTRKHYFYVQIEICIKGKKYSNSEHNV